VPVPLALCLPNLWSSLLPPTPPSHPCTLDCTQTQSIKDGEQKRYRHTLDAVRTIYRAEGLQAFYKGLTPSLMGVSHVAVQFPLYEQLKIWAGQSSFNLNSRIFRQ
jgi:hypothetical protein